MINIMNISSGEFYKKSMKDEFGYVFTPKGPKAENYYQVAACMGAQGMPSGGKYLKEVGKIMTEYYDFHEWEMDTRTIYESSVHDEESVDISLEMEKLPVSFDTFLSYSATQGFFWIAGYPRFIKGNKSARAWVESIKGACQKTIDKAWEAAK